MSQTLSDRVKAVINTPGTGELVSLSEINAMINKLDNHFVPAAKMRNSATQAVTTGSTQKMVFDTTVFDSYAARSEGPMADINNDKIVIRKAGLYLLTVTAIWVNNVTGYRSIGVRKVAGPTLINRITLDANAVSGLDTSQMLSTVVSLNAAEEIEATVLQTSGANLNLDPTIGGPIDGCSLSAVWLGTVVAV